MELAYDSSLPRPNLTNCLDVGNQSEPGESAVDPHQSWDPAGEAKGRPSLFLPGASVAAQPHTALRLGGRGHGRAGRDGECKRVAAGHSWRPCLSWAFCVPRGWDVS